MPERSPYSRRNRKGERTRYRTVQVPGHPLAQADGKVYAHRIALYDKIGPGEHPCHWCGKSVAWGSTLKTDHIDQNTHNNSPKNLVPACNRCNTARQRLAETHCKYGHPYTPENTYHRPSAPLSRTCRICTRRRDESRRPREK